MRLLRVLRQRLRSLLGKPQLDGELDSEIAFHFEQLVQENLAEGMGADEARFAARRVMGNIAVLEQQCREHRRVAWLFDFWQDLRYGFRQLAHDRAVAVVLVLTIALGIGVNTTVFGIVNGFLHPLPVRSPDQIVVLAAQTKADENGTHFEFSYPALQDLRRQRDRFSDIFGYVISMGGFSSGGKTGQLFFSAVTGNYFSALGVSPVLGRVFEPGEGEYAGAGLNMVLGYGFWQKRFGGDPGVIGRQVRVSGRTATVIGVISKEFHGIASGAPLDMDAYLPLASLGPDNTPDSGELFRSRSLRQIIVLGRLKPGVSLKQAQASTNLAAQRIAQDHPETDQGIGVRTIPEPMARPFPGAADVTPVLRIFLLFLAALVLLLACLNVANVLLVRATVRQRELSIRAALGSSRGRLIRQMLAESVLIALLGAAGGMLLGSWAGNAFAGSIDLATDLTVVTDSGFDGRVFLYTMAAALMSAVFIGIWPALRASKAEAGLALNEGGRGYSGGPRRQRLRNLLVIGQVAGSLVLLISAGLFVRGLRNLQHLDLGFTPDHLLNARVNPQWAGYNAARTQGFFRELERRVRAWPEVQSATSSFSTPLGYMNSSHSVFVEGRDQIPGEQPPEVQNNAVDHSYFETLQISILRGRAFRESDDENAPQVAVINQTMANRFWPNQDPLGKRFRTNSPDAKPWEVVGVARDGKYVFAFEDTLPFFYVPIAQEFSFIRVVQVRTTVAPESLGTRLEREIRILEPDVPIADLQPMIRNLDGPHGVLFARVTAAQAAVMGILGLILAVVGVYGVVSYGTAQRRREIGIRLALGATPQAILRNVLQQGVWTVLVGVVAGWLGAAALARLLRGFLPQVSTLDPAVFLFIPATLALVALWACYVPARRATRVDPMVVLRHE